MTKLKTLTTAIAFATFGMTATAAMAQQAPAQAPQGSAQAQPFEQGQQSGQITDGELKKFIKANEEVAQVRDEFSQKLNQENDQQKAQELQMQAQEEMQKAVENNDLDASTYNTIAARLQTDPELQDRLSALQ
ncbi:DUF4168 domain-containing protein [Oceanimonas baumannii]|uniref:Uncharacterized protein DUF4168 n=1 Tax=Oceanimonas baumannii TaxID=129578 RepID=A0A235CG33_9GAMM|nr:DUF4168 domain-containing protein [Oceanimonas baumannii]OYD23571.1 hypothetical protein B6S09_11530 [Oceanimonas baumannii]TDW56893.1 uncharacterized protein DUF4168 [Oceanimonas baumannii]